MSQQIVDPSRIRPYELEPGMVMIRTVVCHITQRGYRIYVTPYPPEPANVYHGIPQGMNIPECARTAETIFPVLTNSGLREDI